MPTKKQWSYKGYFKSINTYINFLCCVPLFLELIFPSIKFDNFEQAYSHSWIILIFRSFRAIRFFQILYTSRTTSGKMMNYVILSLKMAYPGIITFLIIVSTVFICFAGIYYYIEINYCTVDLNNPEKGWIFKEEGGFDNKVNKGDPCSVQSIIDSLWYTIIALSTIGYGDYISYSAIGRVATAAAVMICLFIFALPTISISSFLSKLLIEIHNNNSITRVTEKLNELTISHRKQDMTILNNLYTIKSGIKSNNPVTLFEIFKNDGTDNTKPKLEKRRSLNQYIKETMKNNSSINPSVNKNIAANENTVNSNKLLQINLPKNVARFPNLESIIVGNYDDNFYTIQSIGEDSTTQTTNVNLSTMFNAAKNMKTTPESPTISPESNKHTTFDPKSANFEDINEDVEVDDDEDDEEDSVSESEDDSDSSIDRTAGADSSAEMAVREKIKQLNNKRQANNNNTNIANLPKSFEVNAKSNEEYYQQNPKEATPSEVMNEANEEIDEALTAEDMSFSIDMFEKIMIDYKNICRNEIEHLANRYKKVQKVKEKYEEAAIFQELFDKDILKK